MRRFTVVGGLALLMLGVVPPATAQQVSTAQRMTPAQRQAAVQRAQQARQARGAAMLQRLDKNGDGSLGRDEWPRPAPMFDRLDTNKDGLLDAQELAKAPTPAQVRLQQLRRQQLQARMRRLDTDRDGRISHEEWRARDDGFARLDVNKDGFLSPDELRRTLPRTPR